MDTHSSATWPLVCGRGEWIHPLIVKTCSSRHFITSAAPVPRGLFISQPVNTTAPHFWKALDQAEEQRGSSEWWPLCWGNIYTAALDWASLRCVSSSLSGLLPMSLHGKNSKSSKTKTQKAMKKLAQNHSCSTGVTQVSACPWCSFLHFTEPGYTTKILLLSKGK